METGDGTAVVRSITAVHPDIIESHILNRLDGPSLASASCVSSEFKRLCGAEKLWRDICNSSWPSTLDPLVQYNISTSHRSFFSDASTTVHHLRQDSSPSPSKIKKLISAVDIHYGEQMELICSRVIATETSTSWFSCSPFRIDLLEPKEVVDTWLEMDDDESSCMAHIQLEKSMKLSWILIDPHTKRALNVSSMKPVLVRRHWVSGEYQVRYATVVPDGRRGRRSGLVQCAVVVTCRISNNNNNNQEVVVKERRMQVKEVRLMMEDMEGVILDGSEGLEVIGEAMMNGKRRNSDPLEERDRFDLFVRMKTEYSERKLRRERRLDMMCVFTGVSILLAFSWSFVLCRFH